MPGCLRDPQVPLVAAYPNLGGWTAHHHFEGAREPPPPEMRARMFCAWSLKSHSSCPFRSRSSVVMDCCAPVSITTVVANVPSDVSVYPSFPPVVLSMRITATPLLLFGSADVLVAVAIDAIELKFDGLNGSGWLQSRSPLCGTPESVRNYLRCRESALQQSPGPLLKVHLPCPPPICAPGCFATAQARGELSYQNEGRKANNVTVFRCHHETSMGCIRNFSRNIPVALSIHRSLLKTPQSFGADTCRAWFAVAVTTHFCGCGRTGAVELNR